MAAIWAENLLKLQALDMEIRNLKIKLNMLPKEAAEIQKKIAAAENSVKKARELKAAHELEYKQNEAEIAELNEKIAKLQEQSDLVKKNTEYQAMLGTIAMLKKSISDIETRQIELIELIEKDSAAICTAIEKAKPEVVSCKAELSELAELNNDIKSRGRELLAQRPELRKLIDAEILPRYEQILQKNSGTPLACVEGDQCSNCRLRLTPQTLNQARAGIIAYCDNCMHIIYAEQE